MWYSQVNSLACVTYVLISWRVTSRWWTRSVINYSYFLRISPGRSCRTLSANISKVVLIFSSVKRRALLCFELRESSTLFDQLTYKAKITICAANRQIQELNSSYWVERSRISSAFIALFNSWASDVYIDSSIFVNHL